LLNFAAVLQGAHHHQPHLPHPQVHPIISPAKPWFVSSSAKPPFKTQLRFKVRIITSRAYHALFMHNMLIRPTREELANFGEPDFVVYNGGAFPANKVSNAFAMQIIFLVWLISLLSYSTSGCSCNTFSSTISTALHCLVLPALQHDFMTSSTSIKITISTYCIAPECLVLHCTACCSNSAVQQLHDQQHQH
jgi:hypothetical protein